MCEERLAILWKFNGSRVIAIDDSPGAWQFKASNVKVDISWPGYKNRKINKKLLFGKSFMITLI